MRYEYCEEKYAQGMSRMIMLGIVKCKLCCCCLSSAQRFLMLALHLMESIVVKTQIQGITAFHVLLATLEVSLLAGAVSKQWPTNR